jgi:uncharacterized protein (DUF433 family)
MQAFVGDEKVGYDMGMDGVKNYVTTDSAGVMRVGETCVMLDSVVGAFEQGHSPEAIRAQYPALSLEDVYGAITWCLAHPRELREYMQRQGQVWTRVMAECDAKAAPVVKRLREAKKAMTTGA